jgi:HTH-type transcriptional regulator/antitoxin HipB
MCAVSQYTVRTPEQLPILLKAFRKQAGLTQGQLAARLGITQQTVSALERNADKVSADRLLQLLGILGVEMVLQSRGSEPDAKTPATGAAGW